jgi:carbamoyltransferase
MTSKSIILGIGGYLGHDANAALVIDGGLIAASQEERFTRRKHDGVFPAQAIDDCFALGGVSPAEVTACVFAEKPFQTTFFDRSGGSGNAFTRWLGRMAPEGVAGLYTQPAIPSKT